MNQKQQDQSLAHGQPVHTDEEDQLPIDAINAVTAPGSSIHPSSSSSASSSIDPSIDAAIIITIITIDITGQATPTNINKHSQHTLTKGFSLRVFIPHKNNPLVTRSVPLLQRTQQTCLSYDAHHNPLAMRPITSPTTNTTQVHLLRQKLSQSATHTVRFLSYDAPLYPLATRSVPLLQPTSFAEPKLLELIPTLTGESNFASSSTALKYALDTRDPYLFEILTGYKAQPAPEDPSFQSRFSANVVNAPALTSNPIVRYNNLFNN
ncbi:hypothetical protein N7501_003131 [Penicillium viridicatum]|nr:hypothetical protein N7501_003131 [Penicillium viridicatum]